MQQEAIIHMRLRKYDPTYASIFDIIDSPLIKAVARGISQIQYLFVGVLDNIMGDGILFYRLRIGRIEAYFRLCIRLLIICEKVVLLISRQACPRQNEKGAGNQD